LPIKMAKYRQKWFLFNYFYFHGGITKAGEIK